MSDYARGVLISVAGVALLSPDVLLVRLTGMHSAPLLFWRGIGMALMIGLWVLYTERGRAAQAFRQIGWHGIAVALLFVLGTGFFLYSATHTLAANTLFILATMPVWSALIARFVFGESVAGRTWAVIAVALSGIALIASGSLTGEGRGDLGGDLAALGSAISWSLIFAIAGRRKGFSMIPAMAVAGVFSAVAGWFWSADLSVAPEAVPYMLLLCGIVAPGAFALISLGPRYLPAPDVALIMLLEAVLGPLWVWLALAEYPGTRSLIGGAIVLAALAANNLLALKSGARRVKSV